MQVQAPRVSRAPNRTRSANTRYTQPAAVFGRDTRPSARDCGVAPDLERPRPQAAREASGAVGYSSSSAGDQTSLAWGMDVWEGVADASSGPFAGC